jgi:hypothetical protein
MNADEQQRLAPVVTDIASKLAGKAPGIDAEDIAQSIWLHFLTEWDRLEPYSRNDDLALIRHAAWRAGEKYCKAERYAYTLRSAEYLYSPKEVRALFEAAYFQPEAWENPPRKENGLTLDAGNVTVALWDLREAFDALSEGERALIVRRFMGGESLPPNDRKRLERTIDRVCQRLNGGSRDAAEHDGPGNRRAMSNAASRAASTLDY